jgi:hypothetical protein
MKYSSLGPDHASLKFEGEVISSVLPSSSLEALPQKKHKFFKVFLQWGTPEEDDGEVPVVVQDVNGFYQFHGTFTPVRRITRAAKSLKVVVLRVEHSVIHCNQTRTDFHTDCQLKFDALLQMLMREGQFIYQIPTHSGSGRTMLCSI